MIRAPTLGSPTASAIRDHVASDGAFAEIGRRRTEGSARRPDSDAYKKSAIQRRWRPWVVTCALVQAKLRAQECPGWWALPIAGTPIVVRRLRAGWEVHVGHGFGHHEPHRTHWSAGNNLSAASAELNEPARPIDGDALVQGSE